METIDDITFSEDDMQDYHQSFIERITVKKKDGTRRLLSSFRKEYGNDPDIEKIWQEVEIPRLKKIQLKTLLTTKFEQFLKKEVEAGRARVEQSKQSESRYYRWNGADFRFSSHVYPTGSMTQHHVLNIYDMTDYDIIFEVIKDFNLNL